ncbi:hypothetical protein CLOM_g6443 [Closterium sp. NIES-68]|nr:hypothetical protein CLOM_g6443 [Closterium sp. NIES-68]GJP67883.1 hypothetical protein CLOP_g24643 [Closterium sp. NIES-67]
MQPIVKVQRLGLTVLLGLEEEVASMDDLLHFLAQHAKDAVKRLEEAAYHVEYNIQGDGGVVAGDAQADDDESGNVDPAPPVGDGRRTS